MRKRKLRWSLTTYMVLLIATCLSTWSARNWYRNDVFRSSITEFAKEVDSKHWLKYDVVIVSGSVTCVLELVVGGIRRFLSRSGTIHIVVPDEILLQCLDIEAVTCHRETQILARDSVNLTSKNSMGWQGTSTRTKWYYQQLLKLLAYERIELSSDFFLWDADNILIKPYNPFVNGVTRFPIRGGTPSNLYSIATRALIGVHGQNNVVVHQMLLSKMSLREMLEHICGHRHHESCAMHILDRIPQDAPPNGALSEYHLYFAWYSSNHHVLVDSDIKYIRTDPVNKSNGTSEDCIRTRELIRTASTDKHTYMVVYEVS